MDQRGPRCIGAAPESGTRDLWPAHKCRDRRRRAAARPRRLLNDIAGYRAHLERLDDRPVPEEIAAIPAARTDKPQPAEIVHQILDHRWLLSERAGWDVGTEQAVASNVATVLPTKPDERVPPPDDDAVDSVDT